MLAPICGWLAFPTLFLLLGYSFLKRFTLLCHFGLGLALACAPAGAWLAVSKEFAPGWDVPLWMGLGVISWVGGFDLLYAIQDLEHDKRESLFSIPSKLGPVRTRFLSLLLFCLAIFFFAKTGLEAQLLWPYYFGLVGVSLLFGIMHFLLRGNRLERIPFVFFQINAWVGLVYFAGLVASVNL